MTHRSLFIVFLSVFICLSLQESGTNVDLGQFNNAELAGSRGGDDRDANSLVVQTTSGIVSGVTLKESHAFYGIPYAKPPIGSLRFRDPQPLYSPGNKVDARSNKEIVCYQKHRNCAEGKCYTNLTEDCLLLNVFVPRHVDLDDPNSIPDPALPVLFYIHGGFFLFGAGTERRLDGRWLGNVTNTIIVTVNYRLGVLGFLYLDGDDTITGNQGLKDQQMAMRWIQDNIGKFGGDKEKVTIIGESAGGQAIFFHMVSPISKPLFRRAIIMSSGHFSYQTPDEATKTTTMVLGMLNCSEKFGECLRNATAQSLIKVTPAMQRKLYSEGGIGYSEPFRPFIDGEEFTRQPIESFRNGDWHTDKELIIGTMTEEMAGRDAAQGVSTLTREVFMALNERGLLFEEEMGKELVELYGKMQPEGELDYSYVYSLQLTHYIFTCPARTTARFASESSQDKNVFLYTSSLAMSGPSCLATNIHPGRCGFGYHGGETAIMFRSGHTFGYVFSENDTIVADQWATYIGNFARTGDPSNGSTGPLQVATKWPRYTPENWPSILLQPPKEVREENSVEEECDFFDSWDSFIEMSTEEDRLKLTIRLSAGLLTGSLLLLFAAVALRYSLGSNFP